MELFRNAFQQHISSREILQFHSRCFIISRLLFLSAPHSQSFPKFLSSSCEGNWIFLTACESLRNLYINNTRMIRSYNDYSAWTFSKFTLEGIIFLCRSHIPVFYLPNIFQNFGNGISGRSQSVVSEWWNYRLGLISLNKIWSKQKLDVPVVIFSPGSQNKPFVLFHGELCNGFVCIICVE